MSDIYKTQEETSKGAESSEGVPAKKVEGTEENFQSRYDKLMKESAQKEEAWEKEKRELLEKFGQLEKRFEEPKKEDNRPPQMPQRPADFNMTDAVTEPDSPSGRYWAQYNEYLIRKDEYTSKILQGLSTKIQQEEQLKLQREQAELLKAKTLGAFQKEGLEPEESMELYSKLQAAFNADAEEGAKQFAKWFKLEKSVPNSKSKEFDSRDEKRKAYVPPPGVDGAGGIPPDDEPAEFMKGIGGKKKAGIFQTK